MRSRFPILLCLLAYLLASCAPPRKKAENLLKEIGPARLREDVAPLYKNTFAGNMPGGVTIRSEDWPRLVRAFNPEHVSVYRDGFSLALDRDRNMESGLYVVPAQMDVKPRPTERTRFEPIGEGVYWYSFVR
jgi:hypothetical protein